MDDRFAELEEELISARAELVSARSNILGLELDRKDCEDLLDLAIEALRSIGLVVATHGGDAAVDGILEIIAELEPLHVEADLYKEQRWQPGA